MLAHRLISLLIVTIIILIFYYIVFLRSSNDFEDLYNKLEGEDPTYAEEALAAAEAEPEDQKDAEYYYRTGVILQNNLHDNNRAFKNYRKALSLVGAQQNNDFLFITDRIGDNARIAQNTEMERIAQIIQRIQIEERKNNQTAPTETHTVTHNTSPQANKIEGTKTFASDSQNVHDSALNTDLLEQYNRIKNYNYEEGLNFSIDNYVPRTNDGSKYQKILYVLDVMKSNSYKTSLTGSTEYELLNAVWNRINSRDNIKNLGRLIEAFEDQLSECATSSHSTVCVSGRCSHVISCLALLDKDPTLGILRTKEVWRNQLLNDAAKIVEHFTGDDSATPKNIIDDYMKGENTEEVQALKNSIITGIQSLGKKYVPHLPPEQVDLLIQQCIAVVQN